MRTVIWLILLAVSAAVAAAVLGKNDAMVTLYCNCLSDCGQSCTRDISA